MIKHKPIGLSALLFYVLSVPVVNAFEVGVEFSADAMQVVPGQAPVYSKMYVSKKVVRSESYIQGRFVVDITFPYQGRRLRLYPETKEYIETETFPAIRERNSKTGKTPCDELPATVCKNMGSEILHGIKVDKWQIERKIKDKTFKVLQWIDSERNLSLREMNPDGSIAELKTLGKGDLFGRNVELWEYVMTSSSGHAQVSKQWYDPELKMVIQEEKQGGYFRGFKDIKTGKQSKKLFELPASYQKIVDKR